MSPCSSPKLSFIVIIDIKDASNGVSENGPGDRENEAERLEWMRGE